MYHIHVLLVAIFGMLRIHSQLKHLRDSRGDIQRLKVLQLVTSAKQGEEAVSHVTVFFFFCSHSPFFAEQE